MKAQKITVTITVECLHSSVVPSLVGIAMENFENEFETGTLAAEDGDKVTWEIERKEMVF
jgi:hypothetical protein